MRLISEFRYRPEIDGLRALAVVAVVLFHAGFGCPGGYVGVDVFFVISGFLITSLIWKDLESGCFTFAHFWERRARRIVPALVVVTLATMLAGWYWLLPQDFENLGRACASQAVFAANIHYWLDSGYFAGAAEEKPLLHTWSLAVEEQFYLVVPFLFWAMFRFARTRTRTAVISILASGFALSLAASIYGVARSPSATFYLLPTRAWELLLGSLVTVLPAVVFMQRRRGSREILALAGCALILGPVFFYTRETRFPGLAALPPCLGTALLIWANSRSENRAPTAIGALLSLRPVVFVGLISYSLYLWHWPFLVFGRYLALSPLSTELRMVLIGFGLVFAILSWKYVETPFRERRVGGSRKSILAFAGGGLTLVLACGLLCMKMHGFPQRFPLQAQEFANAKDDASLIRQVTIEDVLADKLEPIGIRNATVPPTVLVWGDSHAMAAVPAVDAFLEEKGLAGRAAMHAATPPVLDWYVWSKNGLKEESIAYNDAILAYIQSHKISDVILIAYWHIYSQNEQGDPPRFNASLVETVRRLVAIGARPWILLEVPIHSFDVPRALSRSIIAHEEVATLRAKQAAWKELDADDKKLFADIESAGGRILDPKPRFLDQADQHYVIQAEGLVLYRDTDHLTTKGAKLMLLPLFRDQMKLESGVGSERQ